MRIWLALPAGLALLLAACPAPHPPSAPPPRPDPATAEPEEPPLREGGAACTRGAQCRSGVCEGQGCAEGVCASRRRSCTRDRRPYCGCDGETFYASGNCPGRLYAHRGACERKREEGVSCTVAEQCRSGVCEGQGCGEEMGLCVPKERRCTRDLATYCSCGGETFEASGSCPGRRFAHRGACEEGKRAVGKPCIDADDCQSGICEGEGCGDEGGVCRSRQRRCTMDLRPYCGCDGRTFRASGSCPGRRYRHRGACRGGS